MRSPVVVQARPAVVVRRVIVLPLPASQEEKEVPLIRVEIGSSRVMVNRLAEKLGQPFARYSWEV